MIELWKDIKNYEGLYQVSNLGNVKSVDRYVYAGDNSNHKYQHIKERNLKLSGGDKYIQVSLCKNGKIKAFLVHRLVAEAFIPNPDNLPCINHKDENPKNNQVENLEWCTYKYNNEYNGRIDKCKHKISQTLKGKPRRKEGSMKERKRYPPTRFYSNKQEKKVAKAVGGSKVANSGATAFNKGDVTTDLFLLECKTCVDNKKSFSIKKEWLEKNKEEQFEMGKDYSALVFNFGPDSDNYYIIDEKLFKTLNKLLEFLEEENNNGTGKNG